MRKIISTLALSITLIGSIAHAQDNRAQENREGRSTITDRDISRGYLSDERVGIRPQAGTILLKDVAGNTVARAAYGLTIDANLASMIAGTHSPLYIGPSTGVIFSHTGSLTNANFFGKTDAGVGDGDSNLFIVPADLKVGYNVTDGFRVAVHGGANLLYKSVASAINTGPASTLKTGNDWSFRPNAGADVEFSVAKDVALTLRPDVTFTPSQDIFTGTVALAFPIS